MLQGVAGVQTGDRIVTSGHGGSFPVGIPSVRSWKPAKAASAFGPFTDFSRLEFVRVVDYGVTGLVGAGAPPPPAAPPGGTAVRSR